MWGALVEYGALTGDNQFAKIVSPSLISRVGRKHNFMPKVKMHHIGNDDQAWWALSVITATELKFPNLPNGSPQMARVSTNGVRRAGSALGSKDL
jgi:mannan endo-1,6-alpha-mannosidase